jgi:hypothetical protein
VGVEVRIDVADEPWLRRRGRREKEKKRESREQGAGCNFSNNLYGVRSTE